MCLGRSLLAQQVVLSRLDAMKNVHTHNKAKGQLMPCCSGFLVWSFQIQPSCCDTQASPALASLPQVYASRQSGCRQPLRPPGHCRSTPARTAHQMGTPTRPIWQALFLKRGANLAVDTMSAESAGCFVQESMYSEALHNASGESHSSVTSFVSTLGELTTCSMYLKVTLAVQACQPSESWSSSASCRSALARASPSRSWKARD